MGLSIPLQCLLQTFFSQNALTETNLRALIAELSHDGDRAAVTEDVLNGTVATLNADISPLDFELRRTIDQQAGAEGQHIWVLCNTTSDALTQLATVHPQNEVAYFKVLLNQIFVTNNTRQRETLAVASMDAVREAGRAGLTKAQAEGCLRQFVAETWLQLSPRGYYSLTARTLMELQGYLRETYNDTDHDEDGEVIKTCHACKEFLTMVRQFPFVLMRLILLLSILLRLSILAGEREKIHD